MADFSVSLTVPDAKVAELVNALRWAWGPKEDGTDKSAAELRAEFKTRSENALKDIFKRHKEYLRSQTPVDDVIDVT